MVRRIGRVVRFLVRGLVLAVALVVLVAGVLAQTPWGKERVLREALSRVEGSLRGRLEVDEVSSPGLLRGFTFRNVHLTGEDGSTFLRADSLRAGLSLPALLSGDLVFTDVVLWAPKVTLERRPGEDVLNVVRIFVQEKEEEVRGALPDTLPQPTLDEFQAEASARGDSAETEEQPVSRGPRRDIALRNARIVDGWVEIRLPLETSPGGGERMLVERGPDGETLVRRMTFSEVDLHLSEALLSSPALEGERFGVESLSFRAEVWPEPFRVEELNGDLRRLGSRLVASVRSLRLPASRAEGRVEVQWGGGAPVRVAVQGEAQGLDLRDLHFLEPRLGRGRVRGPFTLDLDGRGVRLGFSGTDLTLPTGEIQARGDLLLGRGMAFRVLELDLQNVPVGVTDPWMLEPLPLRGLVTGSLKLDGGMEALGIDARLSLADSSGVSSAQGEVKGTLHLGETFGVSGARVTLAPFQWRTLAAFSPAMRLTGPGALRMEAEGSMEVGMWISVEATHVPSGALPSRVTVAGVLRSREGDLGVDLSGELRPLSFTSLREDYPALPVTGEVSGPVRAEGTLSDLEVDAELQTPAGPLHVKARFDAHNPADHYGLDVRAEDLLLSEVLPALPSPTRLSGRVLGEGRGLSLDSVAGEAELYLRRSTLGHLRVDTAAVALRALGGTLHLDALSADTDAGRLDAGGTFALSRDAPPGEISLQVESSSIAALRPFLMEVPEFVFEDLTVTERGALVLEGVNLDTVPRAADVAVDGRVEARATFRGGVRDFQGEGSLSFDSLRLRRDYLEAGTASFSASGLPGDRSRVEARLRFDSLLVGGMAFTGGEAEVEVGKRDGRVRLSVVPSADEVYRARGTFELDTLGGGVVHLDDLSLQFDSVRWNLGGPTSLAWSPEGVRVRDFRLIRPGVGRLRIQADGFLPFRGEGDFRLEVDRLPLPRVAELLQMEEALEGMVDLDLRITGPPSAPLMEGTLRGEGFRFADLRMDSLDARLEYSRRAVRGEIRAGQGGSRVLSVSGAFPADLTFRPSGPRVPEEPVDVTVELRAFPMALALAPLAALEEVEGTVTGDVRLGGTPRALAPRGELRVVDGSALLPDLGVRHTGVRANLGLRPDGTVEIDGTARSIGNAQVRGTVGLDPITDPPLDLRVTAQNFLAVQRRDVQARVSGQVAVTKSYRRPRVQGTLTVEEAVLMVEELARTAEVVDLSDPSVVSLVSEAGLGSLRPVLRTLQASQNPFLQNLQLDLRMAMARGSWLRGREMNVEMAGDLNVYWDRTQRDLALVGDLQAIRGVYTVLGRQFQVQEGTVRFQGTPGVNPDLDITAVNRLLTVDRERLEILASVEGTLLHPRVSLSGNADYPIAESDLVSYLIFGRPTYALASGQSQYLKGATGSLLDAATGATANLAVGLFSSELGSVVTRDVGLDYLAIRQEQNPASFAAQDLTGTMATTQVEIGQYLTDNIFAALQWRPLTGLSRAGTSPFAGLRLEWRMTDLWTLEGFVEDRFSRSPLFRGGDLSDSEKVLGFFLFREWGY